MSTNRASGEILVRISPSFYYFLQLTEGMSMILAQITDHVMEADCEVSGKKNTECVRVIIGDQPEATVSVGRLVEMIRFEKTQRDKKNGTTGATGKQRLPHEVK